MSRRSLWYNRGLFTFRCSGVRVLLRNVPDQLVYNVSSDGYWSRIQREHARQQSYGSTLPEIDRISVPTLTRYLADSLITYKNSAVCAAKRASYEGASSRLRAMAAYSYGARAMLFR
jgi:hypothetical protein